MTIDRSALSLGREETTFEGFEKKPPLYQRVPSNLYKFARRKPLGAFGGMLVLVLAFLAVAGGGLQPVYEASGPLYPLPIIGKELPSIAPYHYNEYELGRNRLKGPSAEHWFGTDQLGRDLFSRILYGAGLSLFIGIATFSISTTISTTITLVSGYYVTSVDLILQRFIEIFGVLPDLVILISLMAIYGATPWTFVLTLGILNGVNTSRVLRSLVIGLRGQPFVEAAKSIGADDKRILLKYIFPNVFFWIIVGATAGVSGAIAAEAGLAIIGFGLDPTFPTWGTLINNSREFLRIAPHMAVFPAVLLAMTIFGFRLLGDALRDVLDPRLRGSR